MHPLTMLIRTGWVLLVLLSLGLSYLGLAVIAVSVFTDPILATIAVNTVVIVAIVCVRGLRPTWLLYRVRDDDLRHERIRPRRLTLLIAGACALVFLTGQTAAQLAYQMTGSAGFDATVDTQHDTNAWLVLGLTVVAAPVAEELLLRGLAYPLLRKHTGIVISTTITTTAFVLMHGNIVQGIAVVPLGVLLAMLYERLGSPWPGVMVHSAYNLAALLIPAGLIAALASPVCVVSLILACTIALVIFWSRLRPVMAVAQN